MTFSDRNQKENLDLSFSLMMAELGDGAVSKTFFDPSREPFAAVYPTTWKEQILLDHTRPPVVPGGLEPVGHQDNWLDCWR